MTADFGRAPRIVSIAEINYYCSLLGGKWVQELNLHMDVTLSLSTDPDIVTLNLSFALPLSSMIENRSESEDENKGESDDWRAQGTLLLDEAFLQHLPVLPYTPSQLSSTPEIHSLNWASFRPSAICTFLLSGESFV